jgi:trk system potassium uptake protein TrkA
MRVAIAGAGPVGRAIAQALLDAGHKVLLIERHRAAYRPPLVPAADWMLADACELDNLRAAGIDTCDVVMAATGDDKANLVFALLCKREFAVRRVVARVNEVENHWLFTAEWGVDVAVSTPSSILSAVEAALTVRDVVRLMTLHQGSGDIVLVTLAAGARAVGRAAGELELPPDAALLAVVRGGTVIGGRPGLLLQAGDELVLAAAPAVADAVRAALLYPP